MLRIFVITHGRYELFRKCLESIGAAMCRGCVVNVVVNGSDPQTEEWLTRHSEPWLQWTVVARESRTQCRSRAFQMADEDDVIYFLDDDVTVPPHLFRNVISRFDRDKSLAVLGGPNLTPPQSPFLESAFGKVMESPFAAPMVCQRYGSRRGCQSPGEIHSSSERELILCNLAIRNRAVPVGLRFFAPLCSNEENLFLYHCRKMGLSISYDVNSYVFHRRRSRFSGFFAQLFSYGRGRGQQTFHIPRSCHPAFLMPSLCVLSALGLMVTGGWWILGGLAGLHLILSFCGVFLGGQGGARFGVSFFSALLTPTVHLFYGLGFLRGFFESIWVLNAQKMEPPIIEALEGANMADINPSPTIFPK